MKNESLFLLSPINTHPFSEGFITMCTRLHFRNLADLLAWPAGHLLSLDGFTYHYYHELCKYVAENDCDEKIKQL